MLKLLGAIGIIEIGNAEAAEDVKPTLFMVQLFEDGVQAVL